MTQEFECKYRSNKVFLKWDWRRNGPTVIYMFQVNNKNLEKVVKFVQNYKWWYQNDVIDLVLVSLLLTLSIPFSSVSINCYYNVELNKPRTKFWLTFVARRCRSSRQAKRNNFSSTNLARTNRAHSLVVSSLRSVTKGSRFEFGCCLCAEVSSLQ